MIRENENTKLKISSLRPDYGMVLEAFVSYLYNRWVKPGDHVIDAGVNAGSHFFPLMKAVGNKGYVHGFEANPLLVDRVTDRAKKAGFSNFKIHLNGLHEKKGRLDFIIYPDHPGLSHFDFGGPIEERHKKLKSEKIIVELTNIDDHLYDNLTFIKMDLEGADFYALRGAKETIAEHKPLIVFECGYGNAPKYGYTQEEFFTYFDKLQYLIFDIHGMLATTQRWDESKLGYEFVAIHREDPRLMSLLIELARFWESAKTWPLLQSWGECAEVGRLPPSLVML